MRAVCINIHKHTAAAICVYTCGLHVGRKSRTTTERARLRYRAGIIPRGGRTYAVGAGRCIWITGWARGEKKNAPARHFFAAFIIPVSGENEIRPAPSSRGRVILRGDTGLFNSARNRFPLDNRRRGHPTVGSTAGSCWTNFTRPFAGTKCIYRARGRRRRRL